MKNQHFREKKLKNSIFSKTPSVAKKKFCDVVKHKKWKLLYFLPIFQKSRFDPQKLCFCSQIPEELQNLSFPPKIKKCTVVSLKNRFLRKIRKTEKN